IVPQDTIHQQDYSKFDRWNAGDGVDDSLVLEYGLDRCFVADTISDNLFSQMNGTTFHADTPIARSELRYLKLVHYDHQGKIHLGEMICNRKIAADLLEIFRELFNERYPIERMMLISKFGGDDEASMEANNTSCFNSRKMTGGSKPSRHAYGMAVDINPLYNPYIKKMNDGSLKILPENAGYTNPDSPYRIEKGDLCHRLFIEHGFKWGGAWRTVKDYQHFEKRP
ncbi:MAG: M15 family metallopeptidase, partial [Muribaculaceae bacterium]|nr:M15 family metallopeptidase [Muribaculaceae bacterium]